MFRFPEEKKDEAELVKYEVDEAKLILKQIEEKRKESYEEPGIDEIRPGLGFNSKIPVYSKDRSERAIKKQEGALRLEGYGVNDDKEIDLKPKPKNKNDKGSGLDKLFQTSKEVKEEDKKSSRRRDRSRSKEKKSKKSKRKNSEKKSKKSRKSKKDRRHGKSKSKTDYSKLYDL